MVNCSSQTISQANATGRLVVDSNRKIVSVNRRVIEMWDFPKNIVDLQDEKLALEFASNHLKNPESFLKKVQKIYMHMELKIHDTIKLKDGRIFERISEPEWFEDKIVGRKWIFHDITGWNIERNSSIMKNQILLCSSFG